MSKANVPHLKRTTYMIRGQNQLILVHDQLETDLSMAQLQNEALQREFHRSLDILSDRRCRMNSKGSQFW